jgi:hypothetical protein
MDTRLGILGTANKPPNPCVTRINYGDTLGYLVLFKN